jgi:hypothetical protein
MDTTRKDQQANSLRGQQDYSRDASVNDRLILERVTVLLSHYWVGNEDAALREAQMSDWLDALGKFPASMVKDACAEWIRSQTKKPAIADIYALCRMMQPKDTTLKSDGSTNKHSPSHEVREYESERNQTYREAYDRRQRWAEDHGCKDFTEAMQIGIIAVGKRPVTGR